MSLKLTKPIIFLDIEATGLSVTQDRIVELSMIKRFPDGRETIKTWRCNPEIKLTPEMSAFLGITDEDLKDEPPFRQIAREVLAFMENADISGFNLYKLDLPLLMEELLRAGLEFDLGRRRVVDVQKIFHTMEKRNLKAAYAFYCQKELDDHHSAQADALATKEVFEAQVERYPEMGRDLDAINNFFETQAGPQPIDIVGRLIRDERGREVFGFGKYRGQEIEEVLRRDPAYYGWMMNGDFTNYTKKKLTEIKLRMGFGKK